MLFRWDELEPSVIVHVLHDNVAAGKVLLLLLLLLRLWSNDSERTWGGYRASATATGLASVASIGHREAESCIASGFSNISQREPVSQWPWRD